MDQDNKTDENQFSMSKATTIGESMREKIIPWAGVLVLVLVAYGIGFLTNGTMNNQQVSIEPTPLLSQLLSQSSPSEIPYISTTPVPYYGWSVNLPATEQLASSLTPARILYATKKDTLVSVIERDMTTGNEKILFEFTSGVKASRSGNLWEGLPPAISWSKARRAFVYSDEKGIKIRSLASISSPDNVITEQGEPAPAPDSLGAPTWSVAEIEKVFAFNQPHWSHDGRYISFTQSHYEGSSQGVYDTQTSSYFYVGPHSYRHAWSPTSHQYVISGPIGPYTADGLFVSKDNAIGETVNLLEEDGGGAITVNFSPDGQQIVFTQEGKIDNPDLPVKISVTNTNGGDITTIRQIDSGDAYLLPPFYSAEGLSILYASKIDERVILQSYNLQSKRNTELAELPSNFHTWQTPSWTDQGNLVLTGIESSKSRDATEGHGRVFIVDVDNQQVIYVSPALSEFVRFLGFR